MQVNATQDLKPENYAARFHTPTVELNMEMMQFVYQDLWQYLQDNWETVALDRRTKSKIPPQDIAQMKKTTGLAQWLQVVINQKIATLPPFSSPEGKEMRKKIFMEDNFNASPAFITFKRMLGIVPDQKTISKVNLNAIYQTLFGIGWYNYEFCYEACLHHAWKGNFNVQTAQEMMILYHKTEGKPFTEPHKEAEQLYEYAWLLPAPETNETNTSPTEEPLTPVQIQARLQLLQQVIQAGKAYIRALDKAFEESVKAIWLQHYRQEQREAQYKRFKQVVLLVPLYTLSLLGAVSLLYWFFTPIKHKIFTEAELEKSKVTLINTVRNQHRTMETQTYEYDFSHLTPLDTIWTNATEITDVILPAYFIKYKGSFDMWLTKPYIGTVAFYQKLPNGKIQYLYQLPFYTASKTWNGWVRTLVGKNIDRAKGVDSIFYQGRMTFPVQYISTALKQEFVKSSGDGMSNFAYATDFAVSADDCSVEFQFSHTPKEGGRSCYGVELSFGENRNTSYDIHISESSCFSNQALYIGDTFLASKGSIRYQNHENNLSDKMPRHSTCKAHYRKDLRASTIGGKDNLANHNIHPDSTYTVRIVNQKNRTQTYLNNCPLPAFETTYAGKIGKLKFLYFRFKGIGSIYFVRVRDGAGKEVYFEDFDNPEKPALPQKR